MIDRLESLAYDATGYVIGAATAYALSRAATGRIPGIVATDPLTLGIVGAIVAVVGLRWLR